MSVCLSVYLLLLLTRYSSLLQCYQYAGYMSLMVDGINMNRSIGGGGGGGGGGGSSTIYEIRGRHMDGLRLFLCI